MIGKLIEYTLTSVFWYLNQMGNQAVSFQPPVRDRSVEREANVESMGDDGGVD